MSEPEPSSLPKTTAPSWEVRKAAEDRFHHKPIVERYPSALAGKPIVPTRGQTAEEHQMGEASGLWVPLRCKLSSKPCANSISASSHLGNRQRSTALQDLLDPFGSLPLSQEILVRRKLKAGLHFLIQMCSLQNHRL
ncbi:hypothetical protein B0H13DRAFT_1888720 [Mycena leptocephala]|nr:hypothetical protein B0H13DRAFT_1888720 [Mycena leptocephala]